MRICQISVLILFVGVVVSDTSLGRKRKFSDHIYDLVVSWSILCPLHALSRQLIVIRLVMLDFDRNCL